MKDIPVFTGSHGIATLVLAQIPWSGCGYVLVRSVWDGAAAFLEECLGFCRACGAERVYASWELETLPAEHAYDMIRMEIEKKALPDTPFVEVEDLTEENSEVFLEIYDRCFRAVPGAASYSAKVTAKLLGEEKAYLSRVDGQYAAIAEISEKRLEAVAVLPEHRGLGYRLTRTVLEKVPSTTIELKVASTNTRAVGMYERLGFAPSGTLSRWWKLM